MPFKRECHFLRAHPAAIVGHFKPRDPAIGQRDSDSPRARVDRVLNQFLERGSRPFHHLTGGNPVHKIIRETANCGHLSQASPQPPQIRGLRGKIPMLVNKNFSNFDKLSLGDTCLVNFGIDW